MSKALYTAPAGAYVPLVANTPKTVIGARAHATAFGMDLKKYRLGFNGISASAVPVLVEVCHLTFATNAPGTASTSVTVQGGNALGRLITAGFTAARNWTTEPTVLTVLESFPLTPAGGLVFYDFGFDISYDAVHNEGFGLRLTTPSGAPNVDCLPTLIFERV